VAKLVLRPRRLADAPDVVHTGCESVLLPAEGLRQSAELEVLLEHENATAALRQRCRGRKSADSGAYDDRVERALSPRR
jgi:hypothetical protein